MLINLCYPVRFIFDQTLNIYTAEFPDFPTLSVIGSTLKEIRVKSIYTLSRHYWILVISNSEIPAPNKVLTLDYELISITEMPISETELPETLLHRENLTLLCEYEGDQILIDIKNNILLVLHSCEQKVEIWFYIEAEQQNLESYLKNTITLLDLVKVSKVNIATRFYCNYEHFSILNVVPTEEYFNFPNNESFFPGSDILG